jgi:hypothetical protein
MGDPSHSKKPPENTALKGIPFFQLSRAHIHSKKHPFNQRAGMRYAYGLFPFIHKASNEGGVSIGKSHNKKSYQNLWAQHR